MGPLRVNFQDRCCFVGALVLGDEVLIGAVPMEDMDLVVNPALQRLEADPRSPHLPTLGSEVGPQACLHGPTAATKKAASWDRLACEVVEGWP